VLTEARARKNFIGGHPVSLHFCSLMPDCSPDRLTKSGELHSLRMPGAMSELVIFANNLRASRQPRLYDCNFLHIDKATTAEGNLASCGRHCLSGLPVT
jgi:hypothetical protein